MLSNFFLKNIYIKIIGLLFPIFFLSCTEQVKQVKESIDAIKQATEAVSNIKTTFDSLNLTNQEAKKFYAERKVKADTVAMEYSKLINYLPANIEGMKPDGDPNGSTQSAMGFSISVAERAWKQTDSASSPRINVTITDIGSKEESYTIMALPLMLKFSNDDQNHKTNVFKPNLAYSIVISDYDKKEKSNSVIVITRYRYIIKMEANNYNQDISSKLEDLATRIASEFVDI